MGRERPLPGAGPAAPARSLISDDVSPALALICEDAEKAQHQPFKLLKLLISLAKSAVQGIG
jgi:hypothetical protein